MTGLLLFKLDFNLKKYKVILQNIEFIIQIDK